MRRAVLSTLVALLACATPDVATGQWLAIAAARNDAGQAVSLARGLRGDWPDTAVIASGDCADFRPGYFLVVVPAASADEAEKAAVAMRGRFSDAYRRECRPMEGSAMAVGLATVDPTIFDVPADAVNWDSSDMVSTVLTENGRSVWIRRWYEPDPEDPLEGRRVSVFLQARGEAIELLPRCSGAEALFGDTRVAVSCETMVAGSDLFHTVYLFDLESGRRTRTLDRCRDPQFEANGNLVCEVEVEPRP